MMYRPDEASASAPARINAAFRNDVVRGLSQQPLTIPPRWFYDLQGSELFEKITELPEYYPTRTEAAILERYARQIAALVAPGRAVVEFGSGSSAKSRILLSSIAPSAYVPIDISGDFLRAAAEELRVEFPNLPVHELEGDFTHPLALPAAIGASPRLGFFPGSTIGNLLVDEAVDLLRTMSTTLGDGSMLLIGIDRIKNRDTLVAAYDDKQGVTAEFNLNLLRRINRELGGTIPVDAFNHLIRWNEHESRIEMHLEAQRDVSFAVAGHDIVVSKGETIHTENSLKYGLREAHVLLRAAGWMPIANWTDKDEYFSLILAEKRPGVAA